MSELDRSFEEQRRAMQPPQQPPVCPPQFTPEQFRGFTSPPPPVWGQPRPGTYTEWPSGAARYYNAPVGAPLIWSYPEPPRHRLNPWRVIGWTILFLVLLVVVLGVVGAVVSSQ